MKAFNFMYAQIFDFLNLLFTDWSGNLENLGAADFIATGLTVGPETTRTGAFGCCILT